MKQISGSELSERANRDVSAAVRCILLIGLGVASLPSQAGSFCMPPYTDRDGNHHDGYCVVTGTGGGNGGNAWGGGGGGGWGGGGSTSGGSTSGSEPDPGVPISGRYAAHDGACPRGNPILVGTGNKIEKEDDFAERTEFGLSLARTYNHYWTGVGLFGKHWVSNLDYMLTFGSVDVNSCFPRPGGGACTLGSKTIIYAWRPSGKTIKFVKNTSDGIFYEDREGSVARIVSHGTSGFTLYNDDGSVETYG